MAAAQLPNFADKQSPEIFAWNCNELGIKYSQCEQIFAVRSCSDAIILNGGKIENRPFVNAEVFATNFTEKTFGKFAQGKLGLACVKKTKNNDKLSLIAKHYAGAPIYVRPGAEKVSFANIMQNIPVFGSQITGRTWKFEREAIFTAEDWLVTSYLRFYAGESNRGIKQFCKCEAIFDLVHYDDFMALCKKCPSVVTRATQ